MKKRVLIIFYVLNTMLSFSQSPDWQWAKCSTGPGYQEGNFVATDGTGNVYITGYFHGPSITFGDTTLLNGGYGNCYLAKYSSSGSFIWAKSATVPNQSNHVGDIEGNIIATDPNGNVYETGGYGGTSIKIDGIVLPFNYSNTDFYLVKYDSSGNAIWVKTGSGNGNDWGNGVATDGSGNAYVTGAFNGLSMHIGTSVLFNSGLLNPSDFFLAKYDTGGNLRWAKTASGTNNNAWTECVAADKNGNVYITGAFANDSISFGSIKLRTAKTGATNIFAAKYDSAGNVLWAVSAGGAFADYGNGITADGSGNVYVTGSFSSDSLSFGPYTLHNQTTGGLYSDFYIAKYDTAGNALWARMAGGDNDDVAYTVATDNSGLVYVSGSFLSTSISFDSLTLLYPAGAPNPMFVVGYDSSGNPHCAAVLSSGSGGDDQNGVCVDNAGNVFVGSTFSGINPFVVGNDSLPLTGTHNVFIAKFDCKAGTAVETITEHPFIEFYPNPFESMATVKYTIPFHSRNVMLTAQDVSGRNINSYPLNNTEGQINISAPAKSGIYFYSLVADGKTLVTKKIIRIE